MKLALFSSVGYSNNCTNQYLLKMQNYCDLFVNYYLEADEYYDSLASYATYISNLKTTKFPALKDAFLNSNLSLYDYIFVFDDDCIIEHGDMQSIPILMSKYNIDIGSPCHSQTGRISHKIMEHLPGPHILRYTNFVEMNFPIFSQKALQDYMSVYNGELCGWGNDWWYLTVVCGGREAHIRQPKNCAIFDSVWVKNPDHHEKNYMTIDKFMARKDRSDQWHHFRHKNKLHEWTKENLEFVYE